jgi:CBS domain-containing protein/sporulation protein YlmC with PRC-barrel domain
VSYRPPLPTPSSLRRHRAARTQRLFTNRAVVDTLVSVAGLIGRPVINPSGAEVGRVRDVVARWDGAPYPPVTGLVVRVGRRQTFVHADQVAEISHGRVDLISARVVLEDFVRRDGELTLAADVIDHQLVDVDGVRVIRAADLYLARMAERYQLVGADVGLQTLLRRLGPARFRTRPTPDQVIDWAAIQPFAGHGTLRLRRPNQELRRLHPAELADLLEELGRRERQQLLEVLDPDDAADALEEMEPAPLEALLRDAPTDQAASLLAGMEPDEAVDALRDLDHDARAELLAAMPGDTAAHLAGLLEYPEDQAGGFMTTNLVLVTEADTVSSVREALAGAAEHGADIDAVLVVDGDGRLIDDVRLFQLVVANPSQSVRDLVGAPWPVTVTTDASVEDVVRAFVDNRGSSVVVIDAEQRPIGRILADDVVDVLAPGHRRARFPRILS